MLPPCKVFVPLFRICRKCHTTNPAEAKFSDSTSHSTAPSVNDDDFHDTFDWLSLVKQKAGALRYIPRGVRDEFLDLLKDLLIAACASRKNADIRKLYVMPRIVLSPLGRGGKSRKHSNASAAKIRERILLWRCRKWQALKDMLDGDIVGHHPTSKRTSKKVKPATNNGSGGLSEDTKRAVVRAVG